MATQPPIEAVHNVKSPLIPSQQSDNSEVAYSAANSALLPNDANAQRSGSTRRSRTSEQSPTIEPVTSKQLPTAPDPPKAPRGPPLSYRGPYEEQDQYANRQQPSMKSFAARAGILPEQMSPRSPRFSGSEAQEMSPVFGNKQTSRKALQDEIHQNSPVVDDRRDYKRTSQPQPQPQAAQSAPRSPNEARYGVVNEAKAVFYQRPVSDVPRANGATHVEQTASVQAGSAQLPIRSKSQRYSTPQNLVATEKSPLQKLELKLNDISKEEKRARVELAEQKLREKEASVGRRISESAIPQRQSSASRRSVSGPIYQRIADQARTSSQRRSQQGNPGLATNTNTTDRSADATATGSSGPLSGGNRTTQSASKSAPTGTNRTDDRGVRFNSQVEDVDRAATNPPVAANVSTKPLSKKIHREQITQDSGVNDDAGSDQQDVVSRESVRNQNGRVNYTIPPQTAAGIEARKSVGFGSGTALQTPAHGEHSHRHLSELFHRRHQPLANQAQPPRGLGEWKKGGVALLSLADMKAASKDEPGPEDEDYQAWWEEQQSGASRQRKSKPATKVNSGDGHFDDFPAPVAFDPPLFLKCGPLLRYCGIRKEKPSQRGKSGAEIWRGSVMIVTDDSNSTYQTIPTLRLFHQPMQLLPPPPKQFDEERGEGLDSEYVDPVGGLPRITRTGGTVYVKPVEDLDEGKDVSRIENDDGLYEETRTANVPTSYGKADELLGRSPRHPIPSSQRRTGQQVGRYREVKGIRLHAERGVTFWRFKLEVELGDHQQRIAYTINKGASVGFWVPARGKSMNIMFHSCNGFSLSVDSNLFSGPDPLWRDVLNAHQIKPFHVMIGGGDQIYNDAVTTETTIFQEWLEIKNPHHKHDAQFTIELRDELEHFYLNRYAMWFSQGLFGMANSQIPMINMWDDHDIIDGFGSYPHHFMSSPVFSGLGNIAFKYYMLFQHQSVPDELEADEPSWLLGASPGPYIHELSRSLFMTLGSHLALLALDCRTERMRDEILSEASYDLIFERCHREIVKGETKHLIVLLGVPIAYPRLVWLENVLTSRVMDPVKALGRMGLFGNVMNKFDGGVEILDDLDDHWTAKNHKEERNWFIEELQELAAEKSIRVTILGGDVHLAAIGQFFSSKSLNIPKDRDFRYMPNVISSAIVNTPPPDMMADVLNKRNKIHHLNAETDENMIPMFTHDVDGKPRNNKHLLPKRNWCSISEYIPGSTPPPTPPSSSPTASQTSLPRKSPGILQRTLSLGRGDSIPGNKLIRRLSLSNRTPSSTDDVFSPHTPGQPSPYASAPPTPRYDEAPIPTRPVSGFHRRPTNLSEKAATKGAAHDDHVDLEFGLDISLNCEIKQGDPSGSTEQYRLLVPALMYDGPLPEHGKRKTLMGRFASVGKSGKPSSYPNANAGSRSGSRDSWIDHEKDAMDNQSTSSQASQGRHGPPVQAGLFRRLSNRLSRSVSQNRAQEGRGALLQKRRTSLDAQAPVRKLEPFKPRPTSQANTQVHQQPKQQQPLQSAMRNSSADTSGAYTVTNNTPRSPPTSFSQKPYNPSPSATIAANAPPRSDPRSSSGTAFNRTAPLPKDISPPPPLPKPSALTNNQRNAQAYSFSSSDLSDHNTRATTNNNHQLSYNNADYEDNDSFSSDREYSDENSQENTYPTSQPPRSATQPTTTATTTNPTTAAATATATAKARNQPRQTAATPSGRGGGAAKFFGEDLPANLGGGASSGPGQSHRQSLDGRHGGYSGIEAYGRGHGSDENAGAKEKKGWRRFF